MENIPLDNSKVDEKGREISQYCLSLPTVLRSILEQFSNEELIKLSLVNKQWNYEARCVLRDRGTLNAQIWPFNHRKDFEAFELDLKKMPIVPFSGICVRVELDDNHRIRQPCYNRAYHVVWIGTSNTDHIVDCIGRRLNYIVILGRLQVKKLSLVFDTDWDECTESPEFLLVEKILEDYCGVLESLYFTFYSDEDEMVPTTWEMLEGNFRNRSYPRLKTLKLDAANTDQDFTRFVTALVSSAPNLKELQMVRDIHFEENVLQGSSAVLVPCYRLNPLYDICESLISALRTETLEIFERRTWALQPFNREMLNSFIPRVLQVSLPTLKTLRMDLLLAVPLMCYGMCLENVTTLEIRLAGSIIEKLEPRILTLLKRFDFTRIFPKVKQVQIENDSTVFSVDTIDAFVEQGNQLLTATMGNRAINIKQLTLRRSTSASTIRLLAQMFPDVKELSEETNDAELPTPYTAIWAHFLNLQELNLTNYQRYQHFENLDSVFCGIFPEEVAELREKDDEYLKTVNIVPVMPSITCLKDLKSFRYNPDPSYLVTRAKPTCCFSKVTGFLCFKRCTKLSVTFETRTRRYAEALKHMEPFVNFISADADY